MEPKLSGMSVVCHCYGHWKKGLGDVFTDEVRNAWGAVYEVLASVMKEGAAEVEKAA